jgi:chromosome segregation ATPase
MLSPEDRAILQSKVDARIAQKKELKSKLHRLQKEIEQATVLRDILPVTLQSKADELKAYTAEETEARAALEQFKRNNHSDSSHTHLESQLRDAEATLCTRVDEFESAQALFENWELTLSQTRRDGKSTLDSYSFLKQYCKHLRAVASKTPPAAPVLLKIHETCAVARDLQADLANVVERIEINHRYVKKFDDKYATNSAKLTESTESVQSLLEDVRMKQFQEDRLRAQCTNIRLDIADVKKRCGEESSVRASTVAEWDSRVIDEREQLEGLEKHLVEIMRQLDDLPAKAKASTDDLERLVAKRRKLKAEIQKKLDAMVQAIVVEQGQSLEVMNLSKVLEDDWREHASLSESVAQLEKKLYGLQDTVERKRIVVAELKKAQRDGGILGLKHQELLFMAAEKENRESARRMAQIDREIFILESEQTQFLRALSELE